MSRKVAVIGAGLIGRAWSMVFARSGASVALYDKNAEGLDGAAKLLDVNLADLEANELIPSASDARARIRLTADLADAVAEVSWVQENVFEDREVKRALYPELDRLTPPEAILASSTSTFPASTFTETLEGRARCLVAHPVNPPYLVPLVEIAPTPWTDPAVVETAHKIMADAGMTPITVKKEIDGFILNRLQVAVLAEAFKLVDEGYVSAEDLDKTVKDGLGYRWSFMGPFETIDLNAPGGIRDYIDRLGPPYLEIAEQQAKTKDWDAAMVDAFEAQRREVLPADGLVDRQVWRDRRLMALVRHKKEASERIGD